jgi:hypothetical protein
MMRFRAIKMLNKAPNIQVSMPPARSKAAEPAAAATAAHCLPAFEKWMQSYPLVSAWIENKMGGHDNLYDAVASSGGFLVIDDFLPANIAAGVECVLRRYFPHRHNVMFNGISA